MISAVILVSDPDPVPLVRTLTDLVPGSVDGLVGEVVLVAERVPARGAALAEIVEESGARLLVARGEIRDKRAAAARAARHDWIFFADAGDRLAPGWQHAVRRFIGGPSAAAGSGAVLLDAVEPGLLGFRTWLSRLKPRHTIDSPHVSLLTPRHAFGRDRSARDAIRLVTLPGVVGRRITAGGAPPQFVL